MGYAYKNQCFGDVNLALESFRASFPVTDTVNMVNLSTSSISPSGLITFTGTRKLLTTGANTNLASQSQQLPTCTTEFLDGYPVQDIFFVVAVVVVWALGLQSGLHR